MKYAAIPVMIGLLASGAVATRAAAQDTPGTPSTPPASPPNGTTDPSQMKSEVDSGKVLNMTVATVGTEQITLRELTEAVQEWKRTYVPPGQTLSREDLNSIANRLLEDLIDRSLLVQEARRSLLNTPQKQKFFEEIVEKRWKEQELPKLLRKYNASSELELRKKLDEMGRSYDRMKHTNLLDALSREFLHHAIQVRMAEPGALEIWAYYQAHPKEFHRNAQVTWREIVIKAANQADRPAARRRAEAILQRLRRGEDFATLAKAVSQGPTAAKGGLWETEPGASAVPAVNAALDTLPTGQVSPIIEGPSTFHIVRVESRRPAGPKPFEDKEVQQTIVRHLQEEQFQKEVQAYMNRLRARTLIRTRFQTAGQSRDDKTQRAGGPAAP